MSILHFPNETLVHIFDYVIHDVRISGKFKKIYQLASVCRVFHAATRTHPIMSIITLDETLRNDDAFKMMMVYSRMRLVHMIPGIVNECITDITLHSTTQHVKELRDQSRGFNTSKPEIINGEITTRIYPITHLHMWSIAITVNSSAEVSSILYICGTYIRGGDYKTKNTLLSRFIGDKEAINLISNIYMITHTIEDAIRCRIRACN